MASDFVELKGFPMPPSDNALKTPLIIKGKSRTVKSAEYRLFERAAQSWAMRNQEHLNKARELTLKCAPGWALKVDRVYWFQKSTIVRKTSDKKTGAQAGEPKCNDTFNRVKALHDVVATLLGIDDKFFWRGDTDKRVLKHILLPECVDIKISLTDMFLGY
jgi:hypothetical protein